MLAFRLIVKGRVQRVGFRRYALDNAQDLGILGYVKNMPDGSVEVIAQGKDDAVNEFIERIRSAQPPIIIRDIIIEEVPLDSSLNRFRIVSESLEEELHEGFGAMQSVFMYEFNDYRREFRDFASRTDANFAELKQEIRAFSDRTDANFNTVEAKYGEISEKLTLILNELKKSNDETRAELTRAMNMLADILNRLIRMQEQKEREREMK